MIGRDVIGSGERPRYRGPSTTFENGREPLTTYSRQHGTMDSESSDESEGPVALPADLAAWVDRRAEDLDLDRQTVVVRLLASYRAVEEVDGDADLLASLDADGGLEQRVRAVVADRIPDIAAAVDDHRDGGDAAAVEEELAAEIDRVETDFASKIDDVRERVIQVKREADAKADREHDHAEFDRLAALSSAVDDLGAGLDDLETSVDAQSATVERLDGRIDDLDDALDRLTDVEDRLDVVEERLRTVAWVVSDLEEFHRGRTAGTGAIDRLKRAAAEADVSRAKCGNCSEAVEIALLTEPNCPHCDATVGDVELPGGIFGKPTLTVARRLESSDDADRSNVPDAADRE